MQRDQEDKISKEYSSGMKMKLKIAVALAHHPKLLILDEPTSGLDPIARNDILDIFHVQRSAGNLSLAISNELKLQDCNSLFPSVMVCFRGAFILY